MPPPGSPREPRPNCPCRAANQRPDPLITIDTDGTDRRVTVRIIDAGSGCPNTPTSTPPSIPTPARPTTPRPTPPAGTGSPRLVRTAKPPEPTCATTPRPSVRLPTPRHNRAIGRRHRSDRCGHALGLTCPATRSRMRAKTLTYTESAGCCRLTTCAAMARNITSGGRPASALDATHRQPPSPGLTDGQLGVARRRGGAEPAGSDIDIGVTSPVTLVPVLVGRRYTSAPPPPRVRGMNPPSRF